MTKQTLRREFGFGGAARTVRDCNFETFTVEEGLSTARQFSGYAPTGGTDIDFMYGVLENIDVVPNTHEAREDFDVSYPHINYYKDEELELEKGRLKYEGQSTLSGHIDTYGQDGCVRVYVRYNSGEEEQSLVVKYNVDNSETEWAFTTKGTQSPPFQESAGMSLVGDKLLSGYDGQIFVLDDETGDVLNQKEITEEIEDNSIRHLYAKGDEVYIISSDGDGHKIYTYDIDTLDQIYEHDEKIEAFMDEPTFHDGVIYIPDGDDDLHAYDVDAREIKWEYSSTSRIADPVTVASDSVFIADSSDWLLIRLDKDSGDEVWVVDEDERYGDTYLVEGGSVLVRNVGVNEIQKRSVSDGSMEWSLSYEDTDIGTSNVHLKHRDSGKLMFIGGGISEVDLETGEILKSDDYVGSGAVFVDENDVYWTFSRGAGVIGTEWELALRTDAAPITTIEDNDFREEITEFIYSGQTAIMGIEKDPRSYCTATLGINPVVEGGEADD